MKNIFRKLKRNYRDIVLARRLESDNYTEHKTFFDAYDKLNEGGIITLLDNKIKLYNEK